MPDQSCGASQNCVWRAAQLLTNRGRPTRPDQLCIAMGAAGDPCGHRAVMAIGGGDWPAQPLCKLHLVLFTRAIAERLEQSDAYAAKRRARQRELERIENLHQRKLTQRSVKRRITGFVYFARRGPNVKIGFSSSPPKRLRDLEMAAGQPFDEVVTMRGNRALEQRYHRRFQEHRVQGEWFRFVDEIRLEMYRLQSKAS